jgi:hypothetical protein
MENFACLRKALWDGKKLVSRSIVPGVRAAWRLPSCPVNLVGIESSQRRLFLV